MVWHLSCVWLGRVADLKFDHYMGAGEDPQAKAECGASGKDKKN